MENDNLCLVRVTPDRFLKADCGDVLECTDTPSFGEFFSYEKAAAWVARLRKKGYPRAVITDAAGELMTYERLKARRDNAEPVDATIPRTWEAYNAIPSEVARRRYKVDSAFANAVDEILATIPEPVKVRTRS
jgi:hypothetical protein